MKQSLQLKVSQQLTLTPQLQQSIRLLQLSTLDLQQEIENILHDNPMLERDEGQPDPLPGASETPSNSDVPSEAGPIALRSDRGFAVRVPRGAGRLCVRFSRRGLAACPRSGRPTCRPCPDGGQRAHGPRGGEGATRAAPADPA